MVAAPLSIKLRCASWQQLSTIYKRDLSRSAMFLKSGNPPALGTLVRIDLTLPSESMIVLNGVVSEHVGPGGMNGRGPGVDIKLATIPQSAMWLIETALAAQKDSRNPPATRATEPAADASADDGRDVADAEDELVGALGAELESLSRLNPFQVLGVGYEVTDEEVRAAFGELTKRYHPDRYARYPSSELKRLAAEIFIIIRDAYRKIGDEDDPRPGPRPARATTGATRGADRAPTSRAPPPRPRSRAHPSRAPPPRPRSPAVRCHARCRCRARAPRRRVRCRPAPRRRRRRRAPPRSRRRTPSARRSWWRRRPPSPRTAPASTSPASRRCSTTASSTPRSRRTGSTPRPIPAIAPPAPASTSPRA
ncbi:MAG: J domain-containing protein [Kofleriaceae bacterium]